MKTKIRPLLLVGALLVGAGFIGLAPAVEDKGAEIILINGGKARDIHFPHHRHQTALENCDACHALFPKKIGSIAELKAQGKLKKK